MTPSIEFPVVQAGLRLRLLLPKPGNLGATPSGLPVTRPQSASSTIVDLALSLLSFSLSCLL
jgi:hypothetical protein